jgi:phosphatidylglycerophosphate synthase
VVRALLYLPDDAAHGLAGRLVWGRTLAVRAMVAALRAGAGLVFVPSALREPAMERALRRMPTLAAAVRWVAPGDAVPADNGAPWLLLPASSLIHASALAGLLRAPRPQAARLKPSADGPGPVAVVPTTLIGSLWGGLSAGRPVGAALTRCLRETAAEDREATGPYVPVRDQSDFRRAEAALESTLGIPVDSGADRYLHRRGSRWLTRLLVHTPVTPNQVSLLSLAIGLGAIWCFWRATPASAPLGILLYALATVVDHADGEIARLTFQESAFGANLDWTIDTIIHAGIVLGIGVTAGGPFMVAIGVMGAAGVSLSALFARSLPREIAVGPTVGGLLKNIANRDLFYILLLGVTVLRWLAPALLAVAGVVVAVGSQAYWVGCIARIRRMRAGLARDRQPGVQ